MKKAYGNPQKHKPTVNIDPKRRQVKYSTISSLPEWLHRPAGLKSSHTISYLLQTSTS